MLAVKLQTFLKGLCRLPLEAQLQQALRLAYVELRTSRTEFDCFVELLQGQVVVFGVEEGHSSDVED